MAGSEARALRYFFFPAACVLAALAAGYAYVNLFSLNIKFIITVHAAIILFFFSAIFLKDFKAFILFSIVFLLPLGLDFHVTRHFFYLEQFQPFETGFTIDLATLLALLMLLHLFFSTSLHQNTRRLSIGHPFGTLFLLWIVYSLAAGALKAKAFEYTAYECFGLFKCFIIYFALINYVDTEREAKVMIYGFLAGMVILGLYMVGQLVTGLNYSITGFYVAPRADSVGIRASGLIGNDVESSQMLSITAPLALAYYFSIPTGKRLHRFLVVLSLIVILCGLIAAKGRAAGMATVVGLVLVLLISALRRLVPATRAVAAALVIVVCLVLMTPAIYDRFQRADRSWEQVRLPLIYTAVSMFKDNWVLGVGASNYGLFVDKYVPVAFRYSWKSPIHNEFLLHLAERGVIGTIIFYWMMTVLCFWLWRATRSGDRFTAMLSVGIFAGLLGSVVIRLFHWYHQSPFLYYLSAVLALAVALTRMADEERSVERKTV